MPFKLFCRSALLAVFTCSGSAFAAGTLDSLDHRFSLEAGYFLSNWDTELAIDGESTGNRPIDLETGLGFDEDDDTYLLGLQWRFAQRHQLVAGYWDFQRSASASLDREVTVGDAVYPVGVQVRSDWDLSIVPVSYRYSVYQSESTEVMLSVGLHWTSIEFGIQGDASVEGQTGTGNAKREADTDAPLPLLGAGIQYALSDSWELGLQASWFGLDFDLSGGDLRGDIYNVDVGLIYRFSSRFSAGLKYTYFEMDFTAESDNWDGGIEFSYHGPQLYLGAHF